MNPIIERLVKIQDNKILQLEKFNSYINKFKSAFLLGMLLLICLIYGFDYSEYLKDKNGNSGFQHWLDKEYSSKQYIKGINYSAFKTKNEDIRHSILALPEVKEALSQKKFARVYDLFFYLVDNYYEINTLQLDFTNNEMVEVGAKCNDRPAGNLEGHGYGNYFIQNSVLARQPGLLKLYNDTIIVHVLFSKARDLINTQSVRYKKSFSLWNNFKPNTSDLQMSIEQFTELRDEDYNRWGDVLKNIKLDPNSIENIIVKKNDYDEIKIEQIINYIKAYLVTYEARNKENEKKASIFSIEINVPIFILFAISPFIIIVVFSTFIGLIKERVIKLVEVASLDYQISENKIGIYTFAKIELAKIYSSEGKKLAILSKYYPYYFSDIVFLFAILICFITILAKWIMLFSKDVFVFPSEWAIWYSIVLFSCLIISLFISIYGTVKLSKLETK